MTIGLVFHFVNLRNDIRKLLFELAKTHHLVLFLKAEDVSLAEPYATENIEIRIIRERKNTIGNYVRERIFLLMRKLPASKANYFIMENGKAENLTNPSARRKAKLALRFQRILPHWISYDAYIKRCKTLNETKIDDIQAFVFLTEIYDDYLFARIAKEKKKAFVYVYSWDHPCKHTRFPKKINYLVWHSGIQQDLITLQSIPEKNILVFGSTQFGYLAGFLKTAPQLQDSANPFIYIGCSAGIPALIAEEVAIIRSLSKILSEEKPHWHLLVRPYPMFLDWSIYGSLSELPNVQLDDKYRQADQSVSDNDIALKFTTIEKAMAFLHFGTTLGLEAQFTHCPSFIVDIAKKRSARFALYDLVHQYQNEKYLLSDNDGVISSYTQFRTVLRQLPLSENKIPGETNRKLIQIQTFEALAKQLTHILQS